MEAAIEMRPMTRFCVKVFAEGEVDSLEPAIPLFHRWIQQDALPGLPLDVVDYRHVPDGPAVQLIGHEADYLLDRAEGPLGLGYNCKRPAETSGLFASGLRHALQACAAIEQDGSLCLRFDAGRIRFIGNDRLAMPNDEAGAARVIESLHREWQGLLRLCGGKLERVAVDPRGRLTVELSSSEPLSVSEALAAIE